MTFGDIIDRENRQIAQEAIHSTKVEDILELLGEVGDIPDSISENLMEVKDIECLKKLLKIAARTDSISDFEEKMDEVLNLTAS